MAEIGGMIFFFLVLLIGIVVIPFGIAGTFIIVADALVFGLITHFQKISLGFVGILLLIAIAIELVEYVLTAVMTKRYGSSTWGVWGSIIGGFFGALWGTPVLPPLGVLLGAFVGAFLGAYLFEYFKFQDFTRALRAGWGAFVGAVGGKMLKIIVAIAMVVIIIAKTI